MPQRVSIMAALLLASVIIAQAAMLDGTKWKKNANGDFLYDFTGSKE